MGMSKEQSECPLCTAAAMETPQCVFMGGSADNPDTLLILQTKNMKGHEWRYMIMTTKHAAMIPNAWQAEAYLYYFMRTKGITSFEILKPTHASITDHFHIVASDSASGEDRNLIKQTDRVQVMAILGDLE